MLSEASTIFDEARALLKRAREAEVKNCYDLIIKAPRVMAYATGRSGFLLRTFIMRLNHLGHAAYFVGEASTPPVTKGDIFLVMSGSGSTATSLGAAMEASKLGASVVALVGSRVSPLGQLATALVELPAPHKRGVTTEGHASVQTVGSLFEQACFILFESMILRRFTQLGNDPKAALVRHANLEA
jgi:6-phospho-3-hexuloisomerase